MKCFVRIDDVNILYYFSVFTKYHCLELQELQDCLVLDNDYNADMLLLKLLFLNCVRHEVPGDGNCLFSLVVDNLNYHPTHPLNVTHKMLWKAVCDYLKNHKSDLEVHFILFTFHLLLMYVQRSIVF